MNYHTVHQNYHMVYQGDWVPQCVLLPSLNTLSDNDENNNKNTVSFKNCTDSVYNIINFYDPRFLDIVAQKLINIIHTSPAKGIFP